MGTGGMHRVKELLKIFNQNEVYLSILEKRRTERGEERIYEGSFSVSQALSYLCCTVPNIDSRLVLPSPSPPLSFIALSSLPLT